jgi:hypothetical protein
MQMTVSQLIRELQKIEARNGGDKPVAAFEKNHDQIDAVLTGIVIIERVEIDTDGDVILCEES